VSQAQGIAHTPTLVDARMRRLLVNAADATVVARDSGLRHLPRFWFGVWRFLWAPPFATGGRLYRRADFEEALARYDAHFHGRVYDSVMGGVVSLLQGSFAPERGTPRAAS